MIIRRPSLFNVVSFGLGVAGVVVSTLNYLQLTTVNSKIYELENVTTSLINEVAGIKAQTLHLFGEVNDIKNNVALAFSKFNKKLDSVGIQILTLNAEIELMNEAFIELRNCLIEDLETMITAYGRFENDILGLFHKLDTSLHISIYEHLEDFRQGITGDIEETRELVKKLRLVKQIHDAKTLDDWANKEVKPTIHADIKRVSDRINVFEDLLKELEEPLKIGKVEAILPILKRFTNKQNHR